MKGERKDRGCRKKKLKEEGREEKLCQVGKHVKMRKSGRKTVGEGMKK